MQVVFCEYEILQAATPVLFKILTNCPEAGSEVTYGAQQHGFPYI